MTSPPRATVEHRRPALLVLALLALLVAAAAALAARAVDDEIGSTLLGAVTGASSAAGVGMLISPYVARRAQRRHCDPAPTAPPGTPTAQQDQAVLDRLEPLRAARRDDA
jgi:hypothetical protein